MLTMPMRCPQCGKAFGINLLEWQARRRYYCSLECKRLMRRRRERELAATRVDRLTQARREVAATQAELEVQPPIEGGVRPMGRRTWCPRCKWWWLKSGDQVCPQCGAPRSPKYRPVVTELYSPEEVTRLSAN